MRAIIERFSAQTSLSTVARVATTLLLHAVADVGLQPVLPTLADLTQVELAAAAGTVKEVVNRALAELESSGAVQRSGGRIVRVDREKLASHTRCL
jgi:DNA-binding GntR family transcriptional regulator